MRGGRGRGSQERPQSRQEEVLGAVFFRGNACAGPGLGPNPGFWEVLSAEKGTRKPSHGTLSS